MAGVVAEMLTTSIFSDDFLLRQGNSPTSCPVFLFCFYMF